MMGADLLASGQPVRQSTLDGAIATCRRLPACVGGIAVREAVKKGGAVKGVTLKMEDPLYAIRPGVGA